MKFSHDNFPPNTIEKKGYIIDFCEEFNNKELDIKKWIPFYLPQWSSREMSQPHFEIRNNYLILKIEKDQKPWCPEFNGNVKCSSIQTGIFSGKKGSNIGQHKINTKCIVREEQQNRYTYLPQYGYFEIRAKSLDSTSNVVALWMIGFEDKPEKSAEICIFEVKGKNVQKNKATIGYGIHKFNDNKLEEAFFEDEFEIDVTKFHTYAVDWTPEKLTFYIDNIKVREINQSPGYPMQLMLGIYEVPVKERNKKDYLYPKEFVIDYVRVYKPITQI